MHRLEIDCLTDYIAVLERQAAELERSARRTGYGPERREKRNALERVRYEIRQATEQREALEAGDEAARA